MIVLLAIALVAAAAWFVLRNDGLLEQVTEARVEEALVANRVPAPMAECMAPKLTDRLSIAQLKRLERFAPQEGESRVPLSTGEAMARLRRIDDREAVETVVAVAGGCGLGLLIEGL
ncbi:MAG: hypothetical protein AAF941_06925 [Pseudomonadota bacterium]